MSFDIRVSGLRLGYRHRDTQPVHPADKQMPKVVESAGKVCLVQRFIFVISRCGAQSFLDCEKFLGQFSEGDFDGVQVHAFAIPAYFRGRKPGEEINGEEIEGEERPPNPRGNFRRW